MIQTYFNKG